MDEEDKRLGEILVRQNVVARTDLQAATRESRKRGISLRGALVGLDICLEDHINWAVSRELGIPFVLVTQEMVDRDLLQRYPPNLLRSSQAIPLPDAMGGVTIVMADPFDDESFDLLAAVTTGDVRRAVGPAARIQCALELLPEPEERQLISETASHDASGVATVYALLVEAYRTGARRILIRPSGDGAEAAFRLERGWVIRKAWSKEQFLPIWTRFRVMAGLSVEMNGTRESAVLNARIESVRVRIEFAFLRENSAESLALDLYPYQPARTLVEFQALTVSHRKALEGLFRPRRQTGIVIVNAFDEFQRQRMLYAIVSLLAPRKLDMLAIEPRVRFEHQLVRRLEAGPEGESLEWFLKQPFDTGIVPTASVTSARRLFETAGDRLILLGLDFLQTHLALEALRESVGSGALLADRLRVIWTGRRVALACGTCGGTISPRRGQAVSGLCEGCNGYGTDRYDDLFEILVVDDNCRKMFAGNGLSTIEEDSVKPILTGASIRSLLEAGISAGRIFDPGEAKTVRKSH